MASSKVSSELPSIKELLENWTPANECEVQSWLQLTLPELTSLSLTSARIGDGGIGALGRALQKSACHRLEALDLSGNDIGSRGVNEIATALETGNLSSLRELYYIDRLFGDEQLATLMTALGSGCVRALKSLAIGGCWEEGGVVGRQGVDALSAAFQSGKLWLLEELSLNCVKAPWFSVWDNSCERSQKISEEGIAGIMRALEEATLVVLRSLHLRNCYMGKEEASAMTRVLQQPHFSSLSELRIQFEDLEDRAPNLRQENFLLKCKDGGLMDALLSAFKSGNLTSLKILDLEGLDIQEPQLLELASVMEAGRLPGLIVLTISSTITLSFAKALVRAYQRNRFLVAEIQQPKMGRVDWPNLSSHIKANGFRRLNMDFVKSRPNSSSEDPIATCSSDRATLLTLPRRLTLARRPSFKAFKSSMGVDWLRCCSGRSFQLLEE